MSETDNKTAKPNGANPNNNNLDREDRLFSNNPNQHVTPHDGTNDALTQDSVDFLDELNFLSFDDEPIDNSIQNTTFKQEPSFSNEPSHPVDNSISSSQVTNTSILHGNHSNFAWSAPEVTEDTYESSASQPVSNINDQNTYFEQSVAEENTFIADSNETFESHNPNAKNAPTNTSFDDAAFNELYDIPSPASTVPSQNSLLGELPDFDTSVNFFDTTPERQENVPQDIDNASNDFNRLHGNHDVNHERDGHFDDSFSETSSPEGFPEEKYHSPIIDENYVPAVENYSTPISDALEEDVTFVEPSTLAPTPNVTDSATPPFIAPNSTPRPQGVPISYNVSQYSRLFSKPRQQEPKIENTAPIDDHAANNIDNSFDDPIEFSEPESVNDQQFEQLLDGLDDELGMIFDEAQSNNGAQSASTSHRETIPPQTGVGVPDIETYQFDNEQVEKTEPFDIPTVAYEEEEKIQTTSFEDEFDDVFNIGTNSNNNSSHESEDEFFNNATNGKSTNNQFNNQQNLSDSSELEISDWDMFNENNLYSDNQSDWSNNPTPNEYQQTPLQKGSSFKKVLISGVCLIAILAVGGGSYYYFTHGNQSGGAQLIHADNTPIRVVPENQQNQNSADNSSEQSNSNAPQQELVDTSETPHTLDALMPPQSASNNDASTITADPNPISTPNVEAALSSGTNNSIPTNTTIAVVVKPDGSVVTERVPAPNSQTQDSQAQDTQISTPQITETEIVDNSSLASSGSETNNTVNSSNDTSYANEQSTPEGVTDAANNVSSAPSSSEQQSEQEAINAEPQQIIVPSNPLASSQTSQTQETPPAQTQVQTQAPGSFYVQLSSQPDESLARSEMNKLQSRYASLLGGRQAEVQRAEIAGRGTYYRVRIPAGSRENANSLCQAIQGVGGSCLVTR